MNLPKIKHLFFKLHSASAWAKDHPQEKESLVWQEKVLPTLDGYYDELEALGVPREFSMCLFCFGIDYLVAYKNYIKELPLDKDKKV